LPPNGSPGLTESPAPGSDGQMTQPTPSFDIIVCGSLHLDIMVDAPTLPRVDETAVGTAWAYKCGGKGGNQAVMGAKLGSRTAMIGRIGADDFGARLTAHLDTAQVDHREVGIDPKAGSGMSVAIVKSNGDYGAVIVSGSNLALDPDDAAKAFARLGGAKILILQNEIPDPVNVAVARAARASGARVILNAAPARPLSAELDALVDLLVVNRIEAGMLSGLEVNAAEDATAALAALGQTHRDVIVTLGGAGLVVGKKGQKSQFIPATPVSVVSTHGAGDCFIGALARSLAQQAPLEQAAEDASRIAARFVSLSEEQRNGSDFSQLFN
jgi:ribokinase